MITVTQHNPSEVCGPFCSCMYRPDGTLKDRTDRIREEREFAKMLAEQVVADRAPPAPKLPAVCPACCSDAILAGLAVVGPLCQGCAFP